MGSTGGSMRYKCAYCTSGGGSCSSKESYDAWLATELHQAMDRQDTARIREVVEFEPKLKERELVFPGEPGAMTALALALNRRDFRATRALLDAGVSPNFPISEEQRSLYAHRTQLAAINGGDPELQHLVPTTHFEALCSTQHK
eukprot:CAMPEP_0168478106 /NCGR_PEP_ID=MMETSP0228-20121227/62767_1 /TAXON_ID=133427 /ORGANISM="Protoceratium reticulatum, Strain CCCM 535 (=CCMP 1889)" /LENGTH=143 /DNA_ID=CAMNT_0008494317 /DNA_START=56 /DNA_END=484 /DNA_ORIENTATION=+